MQNFIVDTAVLGFPVKELGENIDIFGNLVEIFALEVLFEKIISHSQKRNYSDFIVVGLEYELNSNDSENYSSIGFEGEFKIKDPSTDDVILLGFHEEFEKSASLRCVIL